MEKQRRAEALEDMADLWSGLELSRRGEAQVLDAIARLAVTYRLDELDLNETLLDTLTEKLTQPAGEDTPFVSEFLALEVAAALRCTQNSACCKILTALSLKYRHPRLWEAVQNLEIDAWLAEKALHMTNELDPKKRDEVEGRWLVKQYGQPQGPALSSLKKMVIEADRAAAAAKEAAHRKDRGVWVRRFRQNEEGVLWLGGRLDALEGRFVDERLDEIAQMIKPLYPNLDASARRAKALYLAMNPHRLIAVQERLANQPVLDGFEVVLDPADACRTCGDPVPNSITSSQGPCACHAGAHRRSAGSDAAGPTSSAGGKPDTAAAPGCGCEGCGAEVLPPVSKVELVVHIHSDAIGDLKGAARLEKAGWLTSDLLGQLLRQGIADQELNLKVLPVIDLPELPACDGYQATLRMQRAVRLAQPHEAFPFSTATTRLDHDHITPYVPGKVGQTCLDNIQRLLRRTHRAKTRGDWTSEVIEPGHVRWTSPLGYVYETTAHGSWLSYTPELGPPKDPTQALVYNALYGY